MMLRFSVWFVAGAFALDLGAVAAQQAESDPRPGDVPSTPDESAASERTPDPEEAPSTAESSSPDDEGEGSAPALAVIELSYANAEEMAALLSQVLPPGVRVVPYYRTNSLIVSGDPAVLAEPGDAGQPEDVETQ